VPIHYQILDDMDLNIFERAGLTVMMPYNSKVFFGGEWWRPLHHNERLVLGDLADTLQALCDAEKKVLDAGGSRDEALDAVRDYFYNGPIADTIAQYHEENGGLITKEDLSNYSGGWEEPLSGSYGEYTIFANQTWDQGGVVPMALQILDGIDLKSMGHNSPEYIHTVLQAIELAMADREAYFGDPAFVDVPTEGLLSVDYAASRRAQMTPGKAFGKMPPAGDPYAYQNTNTAAVVQQAEPSASTSSAAQDTPSFGKDTSYITVVDKYGNAVSMTPSDFPESPMIPGTGLNLGTRMTQFNLDDSPNGLLPGKRPRITPNPSMVLKDGKFFMSFGTPGGDSQTQAIIQVFLNITVFGMDPQEAISAPRFISLNWPDSFAPHEYYPGQIELEASIYDTCGAQLEAMGYKVTRLDDWDNTFGAVCAIIKDPNTGMLTGGADPREESWAEGK
ncbi:MAG: gamma-glutamyltransferase, partial [Oscillospiraceae bacterium]